MLANARLEEFRRKTEERLSMRAASQFPQGEIGERQRRRIAIIGAGPVGLWAAVLITEKYRYSDGLSGGGRWPDAPEIVIYEGRPQEKHCSRTDIRISLSPATCNLLNSRAKSKHFCTGMPVAEIEERLLKRLKKIAPQSRPIFGRPVESPVDLVSDGFDCVLWAGGRRSLDDGLRKALRCEAEVSEAARVLVFQFKARGVTDAAPCERQNFARQHRRVSEPPPLVASLGSRKSGASPAMRAPNCGPSACHTFRRYRAPLPTDGTVPTGLQRCPTHAGWMLYMTQKMAEVDALVRQVHGDVLGVPLNVPCAKAEIALKLWMMQFHPSKAGNAAVSAKSIVRSPRRPRLSHRPALRPSVPPIAAGIHSPDAAASAHSSVVAAGAHSKNASPQHEVAAAQRQTRERTRADAAAATEVAAVADAESSRAAPPRHRQPQSAGSAG